MAAPDAAADVGLSETSRRFPTRRGQSELRPEVDVPPVGQAGAEATTRRGEPGDEERPADREELERELPPSHFVAAEKDPLDPRAEEESEHRPPERADVFVSLTGSTHAHHPACRLTRDED